ncbi:MAG: YigZ family protein [Bacteroidales bacterium]|nr:YigZ family protein [Bacteroidales bacterium]
MEDSYRTLEKPAEGIFRDRNSRFLAFGFPVSNTTEINDILVGIKKKFHDARHHCYAYRLGFKKENLRMNDDGEPSGTAGKPIYGQLLAHDLTDTLVVVVRYFGGTLLGTSGLINAYRSATSEMISNATIVSRFVEERFRLVFPYENLNAVMKILKEENLVPGEPVYDSQCALTITVRKGLSEKVTGRLKVINGMNAETLQMSD